jgi:hypothetical protein
MEPITAISTALTVTKSAAELSTKLYDFGKGLKDRDQKHQVGEMLDALTALKRSASELEDENRELRDAARFKSDDYEFRTPFYYHKAHSGRPLCAKCFAQKTEGPMGEAGQGCNEAYRMCLVCNNTVEVGDSVHRVRHLPMGNAGY